MRTGAEPVFPHVAVEAQRLEFRRKASLFEPAIEGCRVGFTGFADASSVYGSRSVDMVDVQEHFDRRAATRADMTVVIEHLLPQAQTNGSLGGGHRRAIRRATDAGTTARCVCRSPRRRKIEFAQRLNFATPSAAPPAGCRRYLAIDAGSNCVAPPSFGLPQTRTGAAVGGGAATKLSHRLACLAAWAPPVAFRLPSSRSQAAHGIMLTHYPEDVK